MAVTRIEVYPTCDIHLLLNGPGGLPTEYQLEVRDRNGINLTDHLNRITFTEFNAAIAAISPTGRITPVAPGETFCRIRYRDPSGPYLTEIVVRIRVHHNLNEFWIGNNRATLFKDKEDYVLTVYGAFSDGTIGDISSHPYLSFSSTNTGKVEVNNTSDKGRLIGRDVTGSNPVPVKVAYNGHTEEVPVFVLPPLPSVRSTLVLIHGNGKDEARRNILFVAEGFAADKRDFFVKVVTLLQNEIFGSWVHSPYNRLVDMFNVWVAFDPSPEEGIGSGDFIYKRTDGPGGTGRGVMASAFKVDTIEEDSYTIQKLILRVGFPDRYSPSPTNRMQAELAWAPIIATTDFNPSKVEDSVLDEWLALRDIRLMQMKDTLLGFMNARRYGDGESISVRDASAQPKPVMHWYQSRHGVHLATDRRRMPRLWNEYELRDDYLGSLRQAGNPRDIGSLWKSGGKDSSLVIFLINSALRSGTQYWGIRVGIRQMLEYTKLQLIGMRLDHDVPPIEILSEWPALVGSSLHGMAGVLAHELSHTFDLWEEYEGRGYDGLHDVLERTSEDIFDVRDSDNLVDHYTIEFLPENPVRIRMDRVKWTRWHRIAQCAKIASPVVVGGQLQFRVPTNTGEKWIPGSKVFLRSAKINPDGISEFHLEPVEIQTVQPDGLITVNTSSDHFVTGDIIYRPELGANDVPLTVFHPDVLRDLELTGEPFARKLDPSKAEHGAAYASRVRFRFPDFKPRHGAFVIGLYEGGGSFNTRVYRPSGMCKMRDEKRPTVRETPVVIQGVAVEQEVERFVPLCYVCSYAIVNSLDPTLLVGLPYPE